MRRLRLRFLLTNIGFHTLSNLLIRGISTTIRFGSILPNVFRGVRRMNEVLKLLLVALVPCRYMEVVTGQR